MLIGVRGLINKKTVKYGVCFSVYFCNHFGFFIVSRRPWRYLKTFLDPTASLSFNMGPWRAMATTFVPKTTNFWCSWQP